MTIDLFNLLAKFRAIENVENGIASYLTRVPAVAPKAYLNIVFRPAPPQTLREVGGKLRFPASVVGLLAEYNGAMLFSGALSWYGVVEAGRLLDRNDSFSLPPFNIESENRPWQVDPERLLVVGGYQFDGSRVCIDRSSGHVFLFAKKQRDPKLSWPSLESWIVEEVTRLRALYDADGNRVVPESETVPHAGRGRIE